MAASRLAAGGPVGVFDSGIGGVSTLAAIRGQLPREHLLYVADTGHLPYGERPQAYIVERALRITEYFLSCGAKAVAIPCNTATAAAIEALRARHPGLPIVGIEPAVKPAARLTRSGIIGVLATSGTLLSDRFHALVRRQAADVQVLLKPCPGWVTLVEEGGWPAHADRLVAEPLEDLHRRGADVLVLGCTHFPFLIEAIRRHIGPDVPVLETGLPFARQLQRLLLTLGLARVAGEGGVSFFTSGDPAAVARRLERLTGRRATVERLPEPYC
ncbi:MAG: glutamate racemase [Pigmentiphaga sp.]|uniref:glutamate racemase n=1 Tax=Pigmentiphaga sp. TaxID=1977564 RepID=UPI0029A26408|nr:glutamate racemase [Pigmentiphaga sp.]MDX3904416.1 glutamate racemase [Pigmentiphaga sp.]